LHLHINLSQKAVLILLAFMASSFCSCNSGSGQNAAATSADTQAVAKTTAYDVQLVKGKIADSIACRDNSQNYALYLPANYDPAKPWPCVFFFDAHARGAMPVSMYKKTAERYGFVLIGSNASKNGIAWPVTETGVKALMQDVQSRINIDPKRIYTSGFSGGSRVASSVAIFDGGIAGVIGCAAGFPQAQQGIQNKFDYVGLAGAYDFNLSEMEQLDETLEHNGFHHQLLTAAAIHSWASAADFETGVLWLQINAMKEHLQPKNDTLVNALKKDLATRITTAKATGDWISAYRLSAGIAKALEGLTDITAYKKQAEEISASTAYKSAITVQAQLQTEEIDGQQELQKEFAQHDEQWWTGKIAGLNKNSKDVKQLQRSQMNRRLLSYLGFICYMYSDHALKSGDLANADGYIRIFKLADPKNPDCSYLRAIYWTEKGDNSHALSSLQEAIQAGYSDITQLLTDPAFSSLHNDAGFKEIAGRVRRNMLVD